MKVLLAHATCWYSQSGLAPEKVTRNTRETAAGVTCNFVQVRYGGSNQQQKQGGVASQTVEQTGLQLHRTGLHAYLYA